MKQQQFQIIIIFVFITLSLKSSIAQMNFKEHLIDDNTHGMGGIYVTDLDSDSDLDILAASLEDNQIIWFRNEGGNPASWTKIIIGENVGSAHSVYAADFDNDGDMDIVGAAYYGTPGIAWWRNDSGDPVVWTKFTVAQSFINAHEVYACDLDDDNDFDILGASSDLNTIAWWRNNGGNPITWTEQVLSNSVTLAKSVSAGDLDGDNDIDVVGVSIVDNDIIWWRNDGGIPISWSEFLIDGNFVGAHRVQTIDMDNDGDYDILGAGYIGHQIAWWRNEGGSPVNWSKQLIATGVINACIAYATDLDNDNDLDVIATAQGDNEILWWRNDGNSSTDWTKFIITDDFVRPWPLFAVDFDGDEDIDIVSGSSHNGSNKIRWWENDGVVNLDDNMVSLNENLKLICFPNPSVTHITIKYSIEIASHIQLTIKDSSGRFVRTLVDSKQKKGKHEVIWDGTNSSGQIVSGGIYYCRIHTNQGIQSIKMLNLN